MATQSEGNSREAGYERGAISSQSAARDLLPATIASGTVFDLPAAGAEVIAHPKGGAASARPIGGLKKRAFDLICSVAIITLASPLLISVAVATKALSNGPVVFAHKRVGFRGREFSCLKFRTMVVDADQKLADHLAANPEAAAEWAKDRKLRNDPRVTWIGAFLRKSSLDELPQLINVVRGDMSLVGPRPVITDELSLYGPRRTAYLSARPGMTGLWQVSGRNATTYERRTKLDAIYVRNWRLLRDVKIILRTVPELLFSRGAY